MKCVVVLLAGLVVANAAVAGCSSDFTGDEDAGVLDSSSSGSSPPASSSGAAADTSCKFYRPDSELITPSGEDGMPPAATGGTIADGKYVLDRLRIYGASSVVSLGGLKQVVEIQSGHYVRGYFIHAGFTDTAGAVAGTFSTEGTRLLQTAECSDGATDTGSGPFEGNFTATATELTLVQPSPYQAEWTAELHYVRQP